MNIHTHLGQGKKDGDSEISSKQLSGKANFSRGFSLLKLATFTHTHHLGPQDPAREGSSQQLSSFRSGFCNPMGQLPPPRALTSNMGKLSQAPSGHLQAFAPVRAEGREKLVWPLAAPNSLETLLPATERESLAPRRAGVTHYSSTVTSNAVV